VRHQALAVELKAFVLPSCRHERRGVSQCPPAKIDLPIVQRPALQQAPNGREKTPAAAPPLAVSPKAVRSRRDRPQREPLARGGELRGRHLVVVGDRIAHLDGRLRNSGQGLLDFEGRGRPDRGNRGRIAGQLKHPRNVREVSSALFFEMRVEIVLPSRQAEAALGQTQDIRVALFVVGRHRPAEERHSKAVLHRRDNTDEIVRRSDGRDSRQVGFDRFRPAGLDRCQCPSTWRRSPRPSVPGIPPHRAARQPRRAAYG